MYRVRFYLGEAFHRKVHMITETFDFVWVRNILRQNSVKSKAFRNIYDPKLNGNCPVFRALVYSRKATKIEAFCTKNEDFDQTYVNTGSKTQNVEDGSYIP